MEGKDGEPITIDVRYKGNRMRNNITSGEDLDFTMLFWLHIIRKKLDDEGYSDPVKRIKKSVDYAFDELEE